MIKALWDNGPGTVREIDAVLRKQGQAWAYTTISTLLDEASPPPQDGEGVDRRGKRRKD